MITKIDAEKMADGFYRIFKHNEWTWLYNPTSETTMTVPTRIDIRDEIVRLSKRFDEDQDIGYVSSGRIGIRRSDDGYLTVQLIAEEHEVVEAKTEVVEKTRR